MSNRLEIFNDTINPNAVLIYLYLDRHGARKKQCFHSIRTIAKNCNLSVRTVSRMMNELESQGYIFRIHRYRHNGAKSSNVYEILK
ncbi:helix-turn-helix domain-containing protein [Anaerorhabdus sp.]|uniref:helix-turn-helix domain-containing protein n=1 Tax=Anaerorhabdus sp. TaxID=1872524 RepID=UPI002B20A149|nr:helix-turn-helix domain-containing protein [Anaerorhabdus sp.]MEA4875666.1 helix-turn-helix domain-containing protein [Anaerorhabdus sp.]